MKAVGFYKYLPIDDPEALLDVEVEPPQPAGRDLLVEVKAIAVYPVDIKRRAACTRPATELKILGWDAAGVVAATGPNAELFRPGDNVYYAGSNQRPGAISQLHLVDERIVGSKPTRARRGASTCAWSASSRPAPGCWCSSTRRARYRRVACAARE